MSEVEADTQSVESTDSPDVATETQEVDSGSDADNGIGEVESEIEELKLVIAQLSKDKEGLEKVRLDRLCLDLL